jgi:NAD(P)-dependent dehydrogenase (short-subunit alcohol dehydrogenase family)
MRSEAQAMAEQQQQMQTTTVSGRSQDVVVEPPESDVPPFSPSLLKDEIAMVTGGGSGMGLAMALAMAQAGAAIVLFGRTAKTARAGAAKIAATGAKVAFFVGDVRNSEQIAAAFDQAERRFGPVSILANNAGANYPVLAEQMTEGQWRSVTRIAIDGTFLCSSEFARRRITLKKSGAIINNSAHYICSGFPGDAHSAAAKAAIVGLTQSHARDWKSHGIRVNCLAAGLFPHDTTATLEGGYDAERWGAMVPIGRIGRTREFGWISTFLCSSLAAGISGNTLIIDGGDRLRRALMNPVFIPPRERESIWGEMP